MKWLIGIPSALILVTFFGFVVAAMVESVGVWGTVLIWTIAFACTAALFGLGWVWLDSVG